MRCSELVAQTPPQRNAVQAQAGPVRASPGGAELSGLHAPRPGQLAPWAPRLVSLLPAGLEARFRSKSAYLRYSCESRIRSYLREVRLHRCQLCQAGLGSQLGCQNSTPRVGMDVGGVCGLVWVLVLMQV